ncbi:AraC family transcriptional regulator [Nordella sp. HKS 07]|uniref:AraC family transcriptional regulator n=1 Tax=Nordella sp. HKS 07 TaxID=2712222 RepID=UPI0013E12D2E|nr:AraC family transcriptional regulator [Nordella sp. HKS 07]QIG50220.1 AraC family transcriptional regulator [Nordella sp. HKS 07]
MTFRPNRAAPQRADPLAEILRSVRLTGGVFLDARFSAPWCITSKVTAEDCRPYLPTPRQVIAYHFIIAGRLLLSLDDEPPVEIRAGEIVLLPRNDGHMLASGPGLQPVSMDDLIQPSAEGKLAGVVHGGGGELTHLVCGFLGSEELYNPLIANLPKMLKLDMRQGTSHDWVEASVRFAASELAAGRFASSDVMSRLSELLFVEAVRVFSSELPEQESGWLRGLKDPYVGRALSLIHHNSDAPWTAVSLAKELALSRSAFVDRFSALVGMGPIRYLTIWRLRTARQQLRETRRTIAQIAHAAGYESDEAFSRAFKREFGLSPARWRDQQRDG